MIGPAVIEELLRLLAEGNLSQRKIAKMMNVSRGTVAAVAAGRRRPNYPREVPDEQFKGPVRRCAGCGGMVATPCHACRIRRLTAKSSKCYRAVSGDQPSGLDLAQEHQTRYEEIRRQRMPVAR
jgi:hypothetical protein